MLQAATTSVDGASTCHLALNEHAMLQMIFANKPGGSPRHFGRMYDKKVNLLGLISLMALPEQATPPQLQSAWPQMMAGTMRLLTTLKEQQVRDCFFILSCNLNFALCEVHA